MPILAPNWIFSRFTTWIFGGVRILLVGQCIYILPGRKYSSTNKYPCIDCAIYQLNIQLGAKIEIEIYRYQKFVLLAFTLEKMDFLTFYEVLIY